jgi:uncharacterized protein YjbJ (UPF0337 family)
VLSPEVTRLKVLRVRESNLTAFAAASGSPPLMRRVRMRSSPSTCAALVALSDFCYVVPHAHSDNGRLRPSVPVAEIVTHPGRILLRGILKDQRKSRRSRMKDKMRGKAEEIAGKVTDDKVLQVKGKGRQQIGRVKEAAKSEAHDAKPSSKKR